MHIRTWKNYMLTATAILIWMAVALIILHCLVNNQYGFHRDELNFMGVYGPAYNLPHAISGIDSF